MGWFYSFSVEVYLILRKSDTSAKNLGLKIQSSEIFRGKQNLHSGQMEFLHWFQLFSKQKLFLSTLILLFFIISFFKYQSQFSSLAICSICWHHIFAPKKRHLPDNVLCYSRVGPWPINPSFSSNSLHWPQHVIFTPDHNLCKWQSILSMYFIV